MPTLKYLRPFLNLKKKKEEEKEKNNLETLDSVVVNHTED